MQGAVLLLSALLLGACTQGVPPLNFSVPYLSPASRKLPVEARSITVAIARPDEQETVFAAGQETLTPIWKTALEEALNRSAVFQDDAPRKVSVAVTVLKVNVPAFGVTFPVDTAARYQIINRATGATLYERRIETQGTVPSDFSFIGVARARESVNRSVQANIAEFVKSLNGWQPPGGQLAAPVAQAPGRSSPGT